MTDDCSCIKKGMIYAHAYDCPNQEKCKHCGIPTGHGHSYECPISVSNREFFSVYGGLRLGTKTTNIFSNFHLEILREEREPEVVLQITHVPGVTASKYSERQTRPYPITNKHKHNKIKHGIYQP